tara:strand:+ start:359 stop:589 length:231 start_codon:yes stop_codon:yes gene_type:complete
MVTILLWSFEAIRFPASVSRVTAHRIGADLERHSPGQQRQTLMFPLALLRATRLQTTASLFWPGSIGLITVVHSDA